jgi:hypothetical protein
MAKKKELPWEYCECGCHGHELSVAGQHFWCLTTWPELGTDKPPSTYSFHLHSGHGWISPKIGEYKSWTKVNAEVRKRLSAALKELKKAI